jgi:hypothetical protein
MRAGPLSDRRVIDALNRSFVCVYINNEDYSNKKVSAEERAEMQRIRQEGFAKNLDVGNVRSYVLTPEGHTHDILRSYSDMLPMLQRAVDEFKPRPGKPIVAPAGQSAPPPAAADAVVLHLISRGDDRGSWGQFPAENWVVLERKDWSKLLPTGDVYPGTTWELDRDISARILTYFYPQTENNDARIDRIQQYSLTAKVLTVKDDVVTSRVDGFVRMQHTFYPGRNDPQPLGAEVVGVLTFAPDRSPSLQLVTTQAQHGRRPFTVAVRTVPQSARAVGQEPVR